MTVVPLVPLQLLLPPLLLLLLLLLHALHLLRVAVLPDWGWQALL